MIKFRFRWAHLFACLLGFSIVNLIVRFIHSRAFGQKVFSPIFSRFPFIQQLLTNHKWQTIISLVLAIAMSIGLFFAVGHPRIERVEVRLKNLPKSMDGLTIALLTDLHAGPTVGRSALTRAVELTNEQKPGKLCLPDLEFQV